MARGKKPQVLVKNLRDLTPEDVKAIHGYVHKCNLTSGEAVSIYFKSNIYDCIGNCSVRYSKGQEVSFGKPAFEFDA